MPFDTLQIDFVSKPHQLRHVQVAAIPLLWAGGAPQVLLVTTRGQGRWITPKGWPLGDYPDAASAAREAFEEGGVIGRTEPYSLGSFDYWKGAGKRCVYFEAHAFALYVEEVLDAWPERTSRKRCWFSPETAAHLVGNRALADLILAAAYGRRTPALEAAASCPLSRVLC